MYFRTSSDQDVQLSEDLDFGPFNSDGSQMYQSCL